MTLFSFPVRHDLKEPSFLPTPCCLLQALFSKIAAHNIIMYAMTKDVPFQWNPDCQQAFEALKQCQTESPKLYPTLAVSSSWRWMLLELDWEQCSFLDFSHEFLFASGVGLGAVLAQEQSDGTIWPLAYASCSLQPHEKHYPVTNLPALAIVWSVKHFQHYTATHAECTWIIEVPHEYHTLWKACQMGSCLPEVDLHIHFHPGKKEC